MAKPPKFSIPTAYRSVAAGGYNFMTVWAWQAIEGGQLAIGGPPAGYDNLGLDLHMTTEGDSNDDRSR
jgi:hypothetical protein